MNKKNTLTTKEIVDMYNYLEQRVIKIPIVIPVDVMSKSFLRIVEKIEDPKKMEINEQILRTEDGFIFVDESKIGTFVSFSLFK